MHASSMKRQCCLPHQEEGRHLSEQREVCLISICRNHFQCHCGYSIFNNSGHAYVM